MSISLKQYEVYRITKEMVSQAIKEENKNSITITEEDVKKEQVKIRLFDNQAFRLITDITKDNNMINYVAVVEIKNGKEYKKIANKLYINGKRFKRFLGSTGGLKDNKVIFVSCDIYDELNRRVENGRIERPIVPAKLEAYKSLMFSSSCEIVQPKKILVVSDVYTKIREDIYKVEETDTDIGFEVSDESNYEIENNASDGFSLCTVDYMKKVSKGLGLEYMTSGVCLRCSFFKGMMFPFDIVEYFNEYADSYIVKDIWGNDIDIREVDIVTTESSLKLWSGYTSIDDYMNNCKKNNIKFAITKYIENDLEETRETNYQYLQDYELSDNDIKELCKDTVDKLKSNYCGDYNSTLDFLGIVNKDINKMSNNWQKALLVNKRMIDDSIVQAQINKMIAKKINNAKTGRLVVDGCYATICCDPILLMQKICNIKITGILDKGEVYFDYWNKRNVERALSFRSPMLCMANVTLDNMNTSESAKRWYKHMNNIYIFNAFDTFAIRHEGADCDGDAVITTNNDVLIRNFKYEKTINFIQKSASKIIPTSKDLMQSNIKCFGNKVGTVTNKITAICCKMAEFSKDSEEYKELKRRLIASSGVQQSVIDSCKGVATKGMPKYWYTYSKCNNDLDKRICIASKPYFFKYIYNNIKTNDNKKRKNEYYNNMILEEDLKKSKEIIFDNNCTMNRIAHHIENEFKDYKLTLSDKLLDYKEIRTNTYKYAEQIKEIIELYNEYNKISKNELKNNIDNDKDICTTDRIDYYKTKVYEICNNSKVTVLNTIIECMYTNKISVKFGYGVCGDLIIARLSEME